MRRVLLCCALLALAGCGGLVKQEKGAPVAADSVAVPAAADTSSGGGS